MVGKSNWGGNWNEQSEKEWNIQKKKSGRKWKVRIDF